METQDDYHDLTSFSDLPDESKIRIILESNKRLRNRLSAEQMKIRSLADERDRLSQKVSKLQNQSNEINSLRSRLANAGASFNTKPKKVFLNLPTVVKMFFASQDLQDKFEKWYVKNQSKFKSDGTNS